MKTALPWLLAVIGLAAAAYFFNAQKSTSAQVVKLQQDILELQAVRTENAALKSSIVPAEELARLRKDGEDVLRLRNQVRQLTEQKGELTQQARSAAATAEQAQALAAQSAEAAKAAQAAQAQAQAQVTAIGQPTAPGTPRLTPAQAAAGPKFLQESANACINNLRQLDGAKLQWALENKKTAEASPNRQELAVYLQGGVLPKCPVGGNYTIGAVANPPICTIANHVLP